MKYEAVIFDFDGTVADSSLGIKNSIKFALKVFDIPVGDEAKLDSFIGPPLYESFESAYGVDSELSSKLVDTYRVYFADKGVFECEVFPGFLEILKELKEQGVKLAVASSKPKHFLDIAVSHIGADEFFDSVKGPDLKNYESNKTQLILEACKDLGVRPSKRIAMVGDRSYDIEGANSAGVTSIGVEYGFGSREEFLEHNADLIVATIEDLKKAIV
ncbi:MAG: HAD hydrolase-like protein [Ruminococcaceae bacterium]|nr:HAD hydrolase-like protein [Oscillospiraceae bacterium]